MKFSLFVHMERSDPKKPHRELFEKLEDLVLRAEAAGFESAWIGEHHGMEFTIAPNPFVQLAYLAAKTKRIRLGTGNVIAPFWHPIRLAGEAAMTDVASNGRLDLGIARGAYVFEYERLFPGLDAWGAGQRMRELVPTVKKLWDGDYSHTKNEAIQFLAQATSAKSQAELANITNYAPINTAAAKLMAPADDANLPDRHAESQVNLDMAYWAAHRDEIGKRWYDWQAK